MVTPIMTLRSAKNEGKMMSDTPDTADLRKLAQKAERLLQWQTAACLWEMAISKYQNPIGQLSQRDMQQMRDRAASCRHQSQLPEAQQ